MAVRRLFLVALFALSTHAYAAENGCKIGQIAELPVTMSGMKPMITAKLNGQEARFIVDSGMFYSLITGPAAAEYKLATQPTVGNFFLEGIGGSERAMTTVVKEFTFVNVPIRNVPFIVAGSAFGDAAGIIGQNVLRIADVEYDLANGVIRLIQPKGCAKVPLAYWAKPGEVYSQMEIDWSSAEHPHTTGTAFLNGKKIRVLFDTGASTSMMTLKAAERVGITPDSAGVVKAGQMRGIGSRSVQTWLAPFESLKIGDEEVRNTKLRFGDMRLEEDMLIGADFFLSHRIYVATSQHKLYSTYNGGPVFNLAERSLPAHGGAPPEPATANAGEAPQPQIPEGQPTDAAGFSRRGTAYAARRDYPHAIEDLAKACELAPTEPEYFYQRARAYLANNQPELAYADFEQVIRLKPDHVAALVSRAGMTLARFQRTGRGDPGVVLADLNKASATAAKEDDVHLELGVLYSRVGALGQAIPQYDLWLDKHPPEARTPEAYAYRCRARGLLGLELDKALSDCNRAVREHADTPMFLESRGMVQLRMGNFDKAIADYNAVLAIQPRNAWAMYGRGLAKLRKGEAADAQADIALAKGFNPNAVAEATRRGLTP